MRNQECFDKDGKPLGWFSRSVAVSVFVFVRNEKSEWCVLAAERGPEAADFQGYWNVPCGYLDFDEDASEAAVRELKEETGIALKPEDVKLTLLDSNPKANRQNVTIMYVSFIEDRCTSDFKFSRKGNEGREVGAIKFIPVHKIKGYKWAFEHAGLIERLFTENHP